MASRYISVLTRHPEAVQAYLYPHTTALTPTVTSEDGLTGMVLRTDADDNVDYLVNYQAERLSSGLHGAKVHETVFAATRHIREFVGVDPHDVPLEG